MSEPNPVVVLTPPDLDGTTVVVESDNKVSSRVVIDPLLPAYREGRLWFDTGAYNRLFVGVDNVYVDASPSGGSLIVTDAFDGTTADTLLKDAFE